MFISVAQHVSHEKALTPLRSPRPLRLIILSSDEKSYSLTLRYRITASDNDVTANAISAPACGMTS